VQTGTACTLNNREVKYASNDKGKPESRLLGRELGSHEVYEKTERQRMLLKLTKWK
jgi:hypothetical protein